MAGIVSIIRNSILAGRDDISLNPSQGTRNRTARVILYYIVGGVQPGLHETMSQICPHPP